MMRVGAAAGLLALVIATAGLAADDTFKTIFDGQSATGWKTNTGKDVPKANVQTDGLNPHGSGGYIVVYDKPYQDLVLDFDYKITPRCNSGVFLRVGDLKDPVMTGLEIAIDDTTGTGLHDPGAFYDLVAPRTNAQKPAGEWNHMTITAKGPKISVNLNGADVAAIDLNEWPKAGERPDGSKHKFTKVAIKDFNRPGYFGFQDHGSDCWYKNVKIKELN
jgi:3-keto-disaccharide hydrolase